MTKYDLDTTVLTELMTLLTIYNITIQLHDTYTTSTMSVVGYPRKVKINCNSGNFYPFTFQNVQQYCVYVYTMTYKPFFS